MKYFLSICIVIVLSVVVKAEGTDDKYTVINNRTLDITSYPNTNNKTTSLNGDKKKLSYRELFFKLLHHRCPIH
jgi:hypothetical protein